MLLFVYLQQADAESSSPEESDEVFHDPNDMWEREDRLEASPAISPKMYVCGSRGGGEGGGQKKLSQSDPCRL